MKISEAILDISAPLRADYRSEERTRVIIFLAIIAWNASLLSKKERRQFVTSQLNELLDKANIKDKDQMKALKQAVNLLVERKLALYPAIKDFIASGAFRVVSAICSAFMPMQSIMSAVF